MPYSEIPWKKMAVFDINHGGLSIAKHLSKNGVRVMAFDTYGKADLAELKKTGGFDFEISNNPSAMDAENFEVVCLPIHLSPKNPFYERAAQLKIPIISHHEIVGRLLRADKRFKDVHLIEITGVRGKTSTAILLAQMLSKNHTVLLHTSAGLTYWEQETVTLIEQGVSITPPHVLDIAEKSLERKLKPDTMIFEISLGYTGAQDIGILTEIDPEYQIAGNTVTSTDAKTKMISCSKEKSVFVVNYHDLEKVKKYVRADQELVVYDDTGEAVADDFPTDIYLNISKLGDGRQTLDVESSRNNVYFRAETAGGYDVFSYKTALCASIAAAFELGVSEEQITEVIKDFKGIEGRMREYEESGRLILDNSNSGLTAKTAQTALDYMLAKYLDKKSIYCDPHLKRDVYLVIGEEEKTVCEGLEPTDVETLIQTYEKEIHKVICVGERLKNFAGEKADLQKEKENRDEKDESVLSRVVLAGTFQDGLKTALKYSNENDIIVAAVKCFR